jgi:hypothetical protein
MFLKVILGAWLAGASDLILAAYGYVFPEYPQAGLWVAGFVGFLFLFYYLKISLGVAVKISIAAAAGLTLALFCGHAIHTLFFR